MNYRQQAQRIELKTGGMSVSPQIIPDTDDLDLYEQVSLFLPHLSCVNLYKYDALLFARTLR